MARVVPERVMAKVDGEFVVFLIGMRINKFWMIHKWLPVFLAMPRMLRELQGTPDSGLLGVESAGLTLIQYWRSFDALERYARSRDGQHWPAWMAFNKRMAKTRGDVGIWHETYRIAPGQYEAVYSGMPPRGLGRVSQLLGIDGANDSARGRMSA